MPPTLARTRLLLPVVAFGVVTASAHAEPPTAEAAAATPAAVVQPPPAVPPPVAPAASAEPPVIDRLPATPTEAWIHVAVGYSAAWLEGRSRIDQDPWRRLCSTPCDRAVVVDGLEVRVTAPRMTPSNVFLIEPGSGAARLRVAGGSGLARSLGIIGLGGGLPVTFGGITLLGLGSIQNEPGERTAGIITLAVGAAAVLVALPLLVVGSTTVKNAEGHYVAKRAAAVTF